MTCGSSSCARQWPSTFSVGPSSADPSARSRSYGPGQFGPDLFPSILCAVVPERPSPRSAHPSRARCPARTFFPASFARLCPSALARIQSGRSFVCAAWPRRVSGVSAGWGARLASPGSVVPGPAACAEPRGRCGPRAPGRARRGLGRGVIGARGRGRRMYAAGPPGGRGCGGEGVNRLGGI